MPKRTTGIGLWLGRETYSWAQICEWDRLRIVEAYDDCNELDEEIRG